MSDTQEDQLRRLLPRLADQLIAEPGSTGEPASPSSPSRIRAMRYGFAAAAVLAVIAVVSFAMIDPGGVDDTDVVVAGEAEAPVPDGGPPPTAPTPPPSEPATVLVPEIGEAVVSVDVYSGRPDPTFQLDEAHTAAVLAIIHELPVTEGVDEHAPLGFRGFTLTSPDDPVGVRIEVRPDHVVLHAAGTESTRADPEGRALEALAVLAVERLDDPAVVELIPVP